MLFLKKDFLKNRFIGNKDKNRGCNRETRGKFEKPNKKLKCI